MQSYETMLSRKLIVGAPASRTRHAVVALLTLLALAGLWSCRSGNPDESGEVSISAEEEPRIERIENGLLPVNPVKGRDGWTLAERMEYYRVPGLSIAVIDDFQVVWAKGYGVADIETNRPVTVDTLFQAASVSKPVTAVGALSLMEEGDMCFDDDVESHLESWKIPRTDTGSGAKITLRRILSHTAGVSVRGFEGYPYGSEIPTLRQVLDGVEPANNEPIRVDAMPGESFKYSGGGFIILQQMMEDLSGESFPDFMWERVLEPVGMTHSTFQQPLPKDRLDEAAHGYRGKGEAAGGRFHVYPAMAAAGLWSTAADLGRFVANLERSLQGKRGGVLSRRTAKEMMDPVVDDEVGLGIFLRDGDPNTYFVHSGANAGFRALLVGHTREGRGAVVMANSDTAGDLLQEIVRGIAREYEWEGILPEPVETIELDPEDLVGLAGRYEIDSDGVLIVSVDGTHVSGRVTLSKSFDLLACKVATFCREDSSTRYEFNAKGVVLITEKGERRTAPRLERSRKVPSEYLEAGEVDAAVEAYQKLRKARPQDHSVAERRLNQLGYEAMGGGNLDLAITILEVNTRLYPDSANTYDSLAEAYWNAGQREAAFRNYRMVLEKLPGDVDGEPRLKDYLRQRAEEKLVLVDAGA